MTKSENSDQDTEPCNVNVGMVTARLFRGFECAQLYQKIYLESHKWQHFADKRQNFILTQFTQSSTHAKDVIILVNGYREWMSCTHQIDHEMWNGTIFASVKKQGLQMLAL